MSVWGRPIRDEAVQEQEDATNSEEQCTICYSGASNVIFKPCNHAACKPCVDGLRRSNIFKADAGVKCPYCRAYVEKYQPVDRGTALREDLSEANKAAKAAAATRHGPRMPSIQTVTVPQGISQAATQERWKCPACGKANTGFRETCGNCNRPNPIAPANKETERKDILKCTPDEILALAIQKMHPSLNAAFREAGMHVEETSLNGNNLIITGTDKAVQAAIQKNGIEKLKRIVKSLASGGHIHTLLFHWFGNYTLQDLVAASSKLRTAAVAALHKAQDAGQGSMQVAVLKDVIDGKSDLLGTLVMEVTKDAVDAALNKQGTYALQKVLESPCRDTEFVSLGGSLMEKALQLVSGEPGIYVMAKLVDQLHKAAKKLPESTDSRAAQLLLDKLCALYYKKKAKYTDSQRYEKLRYDMLIAAIDAALPEHSSAMLALMLAKSAFEIQKKSPGRFLVKQLLKLQATKTSSIQVMQNVVCHVGESFEQNLVEIMLRPDDRPPHVVTVLMQELSANEETEWVEQLVDEMVDGAGLLKSSPDAMHILKESLALPCLGEAFVKKQLGIFVVKVTDWPDFTGSVWRERKKKLAAKQAALANEAAAGPSQDVDSPTAGQSTSQVEAQQAAQQLLQGQQPKAPLPADNRAFGSVQPYVPDLVQTASADAAEQVNRPSQGVATAKKVHPTSPIPTYMPPDDSYIPPDEHQTLITQARLHSAGPASVPQAAAAASKTPPPGFPSLNGHAGPSDAKAGQVPPSPGRGRQTSGNPPYNPVSDSPNQPPQAKYTPQQSPERASDPLAFLQDPPVAPAQPRQRAAARKPVKAAFQPYRPPSDGPSQYNPPPQQDPPPQQAKAQKAAPSPGGVSPRVSAGRAYLAYRPPANDRTAAQPDVVTDSAAPPLEVPPPVQPHRKAPEQAYYKPPVDRNTVVPPRGADVSSIIHASQQPLPRSDSDNMCAPDASHGTANAARGMPFVQQQQNKHQMPASHAQKAGRAPAQQAQQRQNAGHGSGQAATAREDTFPRVEQRAAPAAEAASARWTCPTCTYRHEGRQAGFLACAVCGSVRKET